MKKDEALRPMFDAILDKARDFIKDKHFNAPTPMKPSAFRPSEDLPSVLESDCAMDPINYYQPLTDALKDCSVGHCIAPLQVVEILVLLVSQFAVNVERTNMLGLHAPLQVVEILVLLVSQFAVNVKRTKAAGTTKCWDYMLHCRLWKYLVLLVYQFAVNVDRLNVLQKQQLLGVPMDAKIHVHLAKKYAKFATIRNNVKNGRLRKHHSRKRQMLDFESNYQ